MTAIEKYQGELDLGTALSDLARIATVLASDVENVEMQGMACDLNEIHAWLRKQHEPERVEVYVWKKNEETGYLDKVRTKTVWEVYEELRAILGQYPDGGEEYFCVPASAAVSDAAEWPDGDIVCFSVNGSSEGDYVHVEVHTAGRRYLIFLGKTFMGRDASWAFARRLADLLEVQ